MGRWRAATLIALMAGCSGSGREISPIRLEPVATLGATSGDGAIATTPTVSGLHPGGFRIVVPAHSAIGALPLLFSDRGIYRTSLRGDTTPAGTFSGPMYSRFGPGDSIWVFDNSGRVLVFSPNGQYARTATLRAPPSDALVMPDGRIVAIFPDGAVQLIDKADSLVRVITGAQAAGADKPLLVEGANGTFWTSTVGGRWQLQRWDTSGARLGGIAVEPAWLNAATAGREEMAPSRSRAPVPRIVAVWIESADRVWVVGQVADRNWSAGVGTLTGGAAGELEVTDDDKYYDTIVEVRDLATGALIATTRFDKRFSSTAGPGVLVHVVHTSAGWQQAELLRAVLDTPVSRP